MIVDFKFYLTVNFDISKSNKYAGYTGQVNGQGVGAKTIC